MILQAQIIDNTADSLLQLGAIGALIILMGVAIFFISRYFSNQLKEERARNDKFGEQLLQVIQGTLNSNNELVNIMERNFQDIKNQIEILKLK